MSQSKATRNSELDALRNAAWTALSANPIDQIKLDEIAGMAGLEPELAQALTGGVRDLVLSRMRELDRQSVLETYEDIKDAGDVSIREKIVEGLLHRFEVYTPYRSQIDHLSRSGRRYPRLALQLLDDLESVVRQIMIMSGDPADGLKGAFRIKGVMFVFLKTTRIWMSDDSPDLASTMKALDKGMTDAEEWGASFNIFDGRRNEGAPSN